MNDFFEKQLGRALQEIRLTDGEKFAMRAELETHMQKTGAQPSPLSRPIPSPFIFSMTHLRFVSVFMLCLVVVGTGGMSYAAEGSLPGDFLYPMKIKVNEQIEVALAVSPEEKASLAVEFTNRRLEEAGKLAAAGKLSGDLEKTISDQFETQANAVNDHLTSLETKDVALTAELSDQFEAVLSAHELVLGRLATKQEKNTDTSLVTEKIRSQATKLAERHLAYADPTAAAGDASLQVRTMAIAPKAAIETTSMMTVAADSATGTGNTPPEATTASDADLALVAHLLEKASTTYAQLGVTFKSTLTGDKAKKTVRAEYSAIGGILGQAKKSLDAKDIDTARRLSREALTRSVKFSILLKAETYTGSAFDDDETDVKPEAVKGEPVKIVATTSPSSTKSDGIKLPTAETNL